MKVRPQPTTDHGWNSGTMGMSRYRRRSNITIAVILALGTIAAAGIVILVLMLFSSKPAPRNVTPVPSPVAVSSYDPYPVYFVRLSTELPGTPHLTRSDAQARAYLGCGQTFAPGTVDAILAAAYRPAGICD